MSEDTSRFSRLIVYVDESGDHGPVSPEFPVFVLAFCIFEKAAYANQVTSYMHRLKFKHFGHDAVVLHEREIRKSIKPFDFLQLRERREEFLSDLNCLVEQSPFQLIAAVIDKRKLDEIYAKPPNPYHLAMKFCLERLAYHRRDTADPGIVHVVFEGRGKREDQELELVFRRVCDQSDLHRRFPMEPLFVRKQANHCGLQLADLIARPIGRHVLSPDQPNRAYEIIQTKFRRSPEGEVEGWGLKCYP
jgi:hypothetical protein